MAVFAIVVIGNKDIHIGVSFFVDLMARQICVFDFVVEGETIGD